MSIILKKVTVIGEALLKEKIIDILESHNTTGYTITSCEGKGSKGVFASDWEGRNVKIETITSPDRADIILKEVSDKYMENYSLIAYESNVGVLREAKFVPKES